MRVVALGGEPATGKTTVMRAVMARIGSRRQWVGPITLRPKLTAMINSARRVIVLGSYKGEQFDGTDRLSMAVQPVAIRWFEDSATGPPDLAVAFEGDRLFTGSLLEALGRIPGLDLTTIVLANSLVVSARRQDARGNLQGATFLKGRATKYQRLAALPGVVTLMNDEPEDFDVAVDAVLEGLGLAGRRLE